MAFSSDLDPEQRGALLDEWVETRREIARMEAKASRLLAARARLMDEDVGEHPYHRETIRRSMVAEYAAAARMATGSMDHAFADAVALENSLPSVRAAFESGTITAAHVREIVRAGAVVREAVNNRRADAATLAAYDTAALVVAELESPSRTRAHVRQIASALAGETEKQRHRRAAGERAVSVRPLGDGLALLTVVLPEYLAYAILDRLTQLARKVVATRDDREPALDLDLLDDGPDPVYAEDLSPDDDAYDEAWGVGDAIFGDDDTFTTDPFADGSVQGASADSSSNGGPEADVEHVSTAPAAEADVEHIPADTRTLDQIRADLLTDLLLASDPSAAHGTALDNITAHVQVTIAATTLAGGDDRLAELDRHGPLDPDVARDLAGRNGGWTRLLLDPTGMVIETDTYSPTEGMRRFLRARDQHCRFPGCRMPVHRCDIDHNHDHAKGGPTALGNLSHFCRGHHVLKHPDLDDSIRWSARALPDSSIQWTSPLGRHYVDPPPRRMMFV
ncbi:HNH endonuclease signature motif containing protein [Microbacterium hydrocarbonoxydans]|uniref:HNH endonuclease signature motif containing protein n=1 Tax=Microbacterium hydrocarbonoxydans TaxID=273678 RepID=UPI0013D936B4|nr:HNH endonuclease signature motif containing protein [Microbacterium hydrocarbonoxydans]